MNIFFIPSWYPSPDAPLAGIFSKEQAMAVSHHVPACSIGVSLWGQKSEANLLWAKDHLKNIKKLLRFPAQHPYEKQLAKNYREFYTPALTWTDKLLKGNMKGIISANEQNLQRFIAKAGKVSVIHAHVAFPAGYVAMQLAKKHHLPYLITEQMSPFPFLCYRKGGEIMQKVRLPLQQADAVIAISPNAAADMELKTGVTPLVIPNLVDEKLFYPPESPLPTRPFTFFTLGRMVPQKGIPDLLHAISHLSRQYKDVTFRIGGEGENKTEYQQLAHLLGIAKRIEWLGELSRQQAAIEFQQCNAFVLPSLHESMGVVYAEAIACGKPIIATRCGGPEFIVTTTNGLLSEINQPRQLAAAMENLMEHYASYNPRLIRQEFLERFSSVAVSKQLYAVYKSMA